LSKISKVTPASLMDLRASLANNQPPQYSRSHGWRRQFSRLFDFWNSTVSGTSGGVQNVVKTIAVRHQNVPREGTRPTARSESRDGRQWLERRRRQTRPICPRMGGTCVSSRPGKKVANSCCAGP